MSRQQKEKQQNDQIKGSFSSQKCKKLEQSKCMSHKVSQEFIIEDQFLEQLGQENQWKVKPSPHIEQYKGDFMKGRESNLIQPYLWNLQEHQITYISNVNYPMPMQFNQAYNSKNFRIVHYIVKVSYFNVKIKVLNLTDGDWKFQFSEKLSEGMFGAVYSIINPLSAQHEEVAIKVIPYHNQPFKTIQSAVKQYAFNKLLAALQIGPKMKRIFGYDLVTTNDSVMFSMEKGTALDSWMGGVSKRRLQKQLTRLQQNLLLMHGLNICHNDIKPSNIVYSENLEKLVYIDFGFTEVRIESLGSMGRCFARGTMEYCCDEMKKLFMTTGEGFVDIYYNDFICLEKSKEEIVADHISCEARAKRWSFSKESSQFEGIFRDKITSINKKSFSSIVMAYVMHLIQSGNIEEFTNFISHKTWVNNIIEENIKKVCLFFLQVDATLGLWQIFNKFSDTFIAEDHSIDSQTRRIVETKLKPYFKTFLLTSFVTKTHSIYSQDLELHQKILNRFRCNSTLEKQENDDDCQILDVSEDDELKLQKLFYSKLKGVQLSKHIQVIELLMQVFNLRRWYLITQSDIVTIEKCLMLAGVKVSLTSLMDKSNQGIFIGYLKLFSKYLCHIHKMFNLRVIIYRVVKHYYVGNERVLRIALNLILQNNDKEQSIENDNYNHASIKQQCLFLAEKFIDACRKLLSYQFNRNLLHQFLQIYDAQISALYEIRETLIKSQELKGVVKLVNSYLQRYIFSKYDKAVHLYMLAYHQNDYLTYYQVHKKMAQFKNFVIEFRCDEYFPMTLSQMSMIDQIDEFINLMTFVDLIPNTLVGRYRVIERFQAYVARFDEFAKMHSFDWAVWVGFNAKMVLFSLYDSHGDILKAIQLGNELIKEHLGTISELSVFNVLNLFGRLNNSRKVKLLSQKFVNLGEKYLIHDDNELPIETALLMISSDDDNNRGIKSKDKDRMVEDNGSMVHNSSNSNSTNNSGSQKSCSIHIKECILGDCDKWIEQKIDSIEIIWQNCMTSKKYSNKFKEKFYFMRSVIIKKLHEEKPIGRYLHQFLEQITKYKKFLDEKVENSQQLQIIVSSIGPVFSLQQVVCAHQVRSEFILIELQPLLKDLISLHYKVCEKGIIESMWQYYETYFSSRINPDHASCESKQNHSQLLCRMNEYRYVQAFMKNKSDPSLMLSPSNPEANQEIKKLKQKFNDSTRNYIKSFNKQLHDHSFYMIILNGLREGGLMIQGCNSQWIRKQMKTFFLYLVEEKQVFCLFYQNQKIRKFLSNILEIAAQQILEQIKTFKEPSYDLQFRKSYIKQLKQHHRENKQGFRAQDSKCQINEARQSLKQEKNLLFTVFQSLAEFIFDNQCNSYELFFVELILEQKKCLVKVFQKLKYFGKAKIQTLFKNLMKTVEYNLSHKLGQKTQLCWLILLVLMPLKVSYRMKITIDELEWISTFLERFRSNSHDILCQDFYMLSTEYWLRSMKDKSSQNSGILQENCTHQNESNRKISFKDRKYVYNLTKLFHNYRYDQLAKQELKYTILTLKRIKQRIILSGKNKSINNTFERKINCYMRCSLGQNQLIS